MKYNFKEKQLTRDFAREKFAEVKKKLNPTGLFTIVGMPSVGVSLFIRFLAMQDFAEFIYLDTFALSAQTKHEFYIALLKELGGTKIPNDEQEILEECRVRVKKLTQKHGHVIFLFNRFDQLGRQIDKNFLGNLRTLRHVAADKISIIFVSHKPLYEISKDAVSGGNLDVFSNFMYFTLYPERDLLALLKLHSPELINSEKNILDAIKLSGGHFQLLQLILKSERVDLTKDRFVEMSLREIYESLVYSQKKMLQKIVFGKKIGDMDPYLLHTGLVCKEKGLYQIFSPLFTQFIKKNAKLKLPIKELQLFKLLKQNEGKVVDKEEVFKILWEDNNEEFASDWALNALIYRLRKNPAFLAGGYVIESYKKQGYSLIKT